MNELAYPLQWPAGWIRHKQQLHSRFRNQTISGASKALVRELNLLGAKELVISTNLPLRKSDGLPKSNQKQPEDRGVAVYFQLEGKSQCIPCDKWNSIEDNLWAIAESVRVLRSLERWGAKQMVDAAFSGFKALPTGTNPYWEILGCKPDSPLEVMEEKYKRLAKLFHSDLNGGGDEKMKLLNVAMDEARRIHSVSKAS